MSFKKHFERIVNRAIEMASTPEEPQFKLEPPKPLSETEIRNDILNYLVQKGYFPLKYKNMGVYNPKLYGGRGGFQKDNSRYFVKGAFDILAGKPGDIIWIETKTESEMAYIRKHRADIEAGKNLRVERRFHIWEQIKFEKTITKAWGCRAFFAGSVRDVAAVICPEDLEWIR